MNPIPKETFCHLLKKTQLRISPEHGVSTGPPQATPSSSWTQADFFQLSSDTGDLIVMKQAGKMTLLGISWKEKEEEG